MTRCMRPVRRLEASCGAASPCPPSEQLKRIKTANDDQKTASNRAQGALPPARQIAITPVKTVRHRRQDPREGQYNYGFTRRPAKYGNLVTKGIIDPTKVVRAAIQNAASGRGSPDHHRSHDRRTAEEGVRSRRRQPSGGRAWGMDS